MNWIEVSTAMPEELPELVIKRNENDCLNPETTKKLIVLTDCGTVTDNKRIKMQVGEKEWVWFMGYEGETVTHYMLFEEPTIMTYDDLREIR